MIFAYILEYSLIPNESLSRSRWSSRRFLVIECSGQGRAVLVNEGGPSGHKSRVVNVALPEHRQIHSGDDFHHLLHFEDATRLQKIESTATASDDALVHWRIRRCLQQYPRIQAVKVGVGGGAGFGTILKHVAR